MDTIGREKKLIAYIQWDEYIDILHKNGSIAALDAIFIESKKLSKWELNQATEWFANVLWMFQSDDVINRQPLTLWDIAWRDKIHHFALAFDLTYNYWASAKAIDLWGILWEVKDVFEPLLMQWGIWYDQNDIVADRYWIAFALALNSNENILPSYILSQNSPDGYLENYLNIFNIPSTY